jgi:murein DD-endopeptidase MepM/ murein hydrolase activator NlpD
MSCGGNGKAIAPGDPWVVNEDNYDSPTYKQPSECDEGYLARAGNAEGELAGGPQEKGKIQNVSIPVATDLSVTTQMAMTPDSPAVDHWTNGTSIPGLTFDESTGKFSGTISLEGKYSTTISAIAADGSTIDSKGYQLVAQKSTGEDVITFIHPMPGSVITSRCTASVDGTKIWDDPKRGRPHKGIDLAFAGGKTGNVRAAATGEVIRAVSDGSASGYGNVVYIGHKNAAGKKICISVYGHLASVAVKVGQQVSSGDLIGVEGNTGHSSGAHLHFEIRSPEFASSNQAAAVYDPAAYISGEVKFDDVSPRTALDTGKDPDPATPNPATTTTQNNGTKVAVTPAMADNKCSGYTPEPGNPGPTGTGEKVAPFNTAPVKTGECFVDSLEFVLKEEVGQWFKSSDPETQQGLITTYPQRKKCGYVTDTGGETKYGVAKNSNQGTNITSLNLDGAKSILQNKYWTPNKCDQLPKPLCLVHYDACVNQGPGAASGFLQKAVGASSLSAAVTKAAAMNDSDAADAAKKYINVRQNHYDDLANGNPSKYKKYLNGWSSRLNRLKAFI